VKARRHPVELGEDVLGEVERAVRQDVALGAAQDPERRERLVRRRDLLALPAQVVRRDARDDADVRRVVADREVLVAERAGRLAHLEHGRASVRPGRVAVEVAAHVAELEERGRLAAERPLAQLRRAERDPERRVDGLLGRRVGQRLERVDVGGRAGRPQERGAGHGRIRKHEPDREAVGRHAGRAAGMLLDHGHDLRRGGEALAGRGGIARDGDYDEGVRCVHAAADVARDLPADRVGDALEELAASVQEEAASLAGRALEPRPKSLGRLRPDPGRVPDRPVLDRAGELGGRADAEGARRVERALRGQAEVAAVTDHLGRDRPLELLELFEPPGLDELDELGLDARADSP